MTYQWDKQRSYVFEVSADYIMREGNDRRKLILHVDERNATRPSYDTQGAMDLWHKLKGRKIRSG